ncbi:MAG: hypothetical protein EOM21_21450 [Gammaproteobacteria bacterium]|nr:hypothetical protein [Gammaproteobacteria bacterium]
MPVEFSVTQRRQIQIKDATSCNARAAAAGLEKGSSVFGFTLGQFSVSDLIAEVLAKTGPADVTISTWTASGAKIDEAFELFESGLIRSCRWLLDPGFKSRQPKFAEVLVRRFGHNCIRTVANHAKFVVIRNEEWSVVIKTSMNLNNNPRLENFEIVEGDELADYISGFVDYIFETSPPDENFALKEYGGLHRKTRQITEDDLLAAIG